MYAKNKETYPDTESAREEWHPLQLSCFDLQVKEKRKVFITSCARGNDSSSEI